MIDIKMDPQRRKFVCRKLIQISAKSCPAVSPRPNFDNHGLFYIQM